MHPFSHIVPRIACWLVIALSFISLRSNAADKDLFFETSIAPILNKHCSDCHNPHGSNGDAMLNRQSVNETCYTCHAEKRGPFAQEHEPVADNCLNCHTPHGSNHDNLLTVASPMLCQQCHDRSRGHGQELWNPNDLGSERYQIGNACGNCHTQVHGSNSRGARSLRQ